MFDLQNLCYLVLIFAFASFAQGFTGLGFGIIAIAGIAFTPFDIERATVVSNILLVVLGSTILAAGKKDLKLDWKLIGFILAGVCVGVPIGYWFILTFSNRPIFRLVLGVVLLFFALLGIFKLHIRTRLPLAMGTLAGIVSGFSTGSFNAGGPPIALFVYSRQEKPSDAKFTLQIIFITTTMWRLLYIIIFGKGITIEIFKIIGISIPFVIFFSAIGHYLSNRFSGATFLRVVYIFIGLAGILNIIIGIQ